MQFRIFVQYNDAVYCETHQSLPLPHIFAALNTPPVWKDIQHGRATPKEGAISDLVDMLSAIFGLLINSYWRNTCLLKRLFHFHAGVYKVRLAINPSARRFVKSFAEKPVYISHSSKNV